MKRRSDRLRGSAPGQEAEDGDFGEKYPQLYQHMVMGVWEDGAERQTSTLLVFCEGGLFKACLNDRAEGAVAFVSSSSWEGLLEALEGSLDDGTLEWREKGSGKK